MKSDGLFKPAVLVLIAALIFYFVAYTGIEHRRTRKGPWRVTFTQTEGHPAIVINQRMLAITNVQISFSGLPGQSAGPPVEFSFSQPKQVPYDVPFGTCLFMDTTFLPGTIVFKLFGHEIQLIPRALTIDRKEYAWFANEVIALSGTNSIRQPVVP